MDGYTYTDADGFKYEFDPRDENYWADCYESDGE